MRRLPLIVFCVLTAGICLGGVTQMMQMVIARKNAGGAPAAELPLTALAHQWMADGDVYNTGTTQATDGQTIATWVDEISASNLLQTTEGDKPLFQTSVQNGKPGIQFVSSDHVETGAALWAFAATGDFSVYIAFSTTDESNNQVLMGFCDVSAAADRYIFRARGDSSNFINFTEVDTTGASASTTSGYVSGVASVASFERVSSTFRTVWIDGGSGGTNTSSRSPDNVDECVVGATINSSVYGSFFTGYIYEILVYTVDHNTSDRGDVEAYLNDKWGL